MTLLSRGRESSLFGNATSFWRAPSDGAGDGNREREGMTRTEIALLNARIFGIFRFWTYWLRSALDEAFSS